MKAPTIAVGGLASATLLTIGMTIGGCGTAAAVPGDYSTLPVDPNVVTDSLAYSAGQSIQNPNGQAGVTNTYSHRDGTRQITNTILILPDAPSATAALNEAQAPKIANAKTQPVAVGSAGTVVSGMSPDGTQSITLLTFTEGNATTAIEFDGPPKDPAPTDFVIDFGQQQDTAIKSWLSA